MAPLGLGLLAVAAWIVASVLLWSRRHEQRCRREVERGVIEIITIEGATPVEIDDDYSDGPTFAFDLSEGRVMVLQGAWLMDPQTFGEDEEFEDTADGYANLLPPPCAFPCTSFRVHRYPESGQVVRIEILGDYSSPEHRIEDANLELMGTSTSYFGPGSVEDLKRSATP